MLYFYKSFFTLTANKPTYWLFNNTRLFFIRQKTFKNMKLIIILTLLTFSTIVNGNNVERLDAKFKSLYLTGNMVLWKQAVDSLRLTKTDAQTEMVLLYAEYGLIGNYLGAKQQGLAKVEIPLFEKRIEQALKRRPNDAG